MDAVLIVITLGALGLSAALAIFGWKLLRTPAGEGEMASRVEALRALAAEPDPAPMVEPGTPASRAPIPVAPPVLAAAPVVVGPAPRLDLPLEPVAMPVPMRFATLGAATTPADDWDATLGTAPVAPMSSAATLFGAPPAHARARQPLLVATVGLVILASAGTAYAIHRTPAPTTRGVDEQIVPAGTVPLDLLSLAETVDPDGTFTVTGLVGNPTTGKAASQVLAVVYLFDQGGRYFATARASIDHPTLAPGDQSPFVVKVPHGATAARYRVGFRNIDGTVVAHVDKRGEAIEGTTGGETTPKGAGR